MHMFCIGCISNWFRQKQTCPICKRAISSNYVMMARPDSENVGDGNKTDDEDQDYDSDDVCQGYDYEFDWSYMPAEMMKNIKFLDVNDPKTHKTRVGKK